MISQYFGRLGDKGILAAQWPRIVTISAWCADRSKTCPSRSSLGKQRIPMPAQSTDIEFEKSRPLVCYLSTSDNSELGSENMDIRAILNWYLLYVDILYLP